MGNHSNQSKECEYVMEFQLVRFNILIKGFGDVRHKGPFTLRICFLHLRQIATLCLWDVASNAKNRYRTHSLRLNQIMQKNA